MCESTANLANLAAAEAARATSATSLEEQQDGRRPVGTYGLLFSPTGNVICSYCGWISARVTCDEARHLAQCPSCRRQMPPCLDCGAGAGEPCTYGCSSHWI